MSSVGLEPTPNGHRSLIQHPVRLGNSIQMFMCALTLQYHGMRLEWIHVWQYMIISNCILFDVFVQSRDNIYIGIRNTDLSESQFQYTSYQSEFDTCFFTLVFILIICDNIVKVWAHLTIWIGWPSGLGRWIKLRRPSSVGSNSTGDIFHFDLFAPYPFLTRRRIPFQWNQAWHSSRVKGSVHRENDCFLKYDGVLLLVHDSFKWDLSCMLTRKNIIHVFIQCIYHTQNLQSQFLWHAIFEVGNSKELSRFILFYAPNPEAIF